MIICFHEWLYVDNDEHCDHVYWQCLHCYEKRDQDPSLVIAYLNPAPAIGANIDEEA